MWAGAFWANAHWPVAYWAKLGAAPPVAADPGPWKVDVAHSWQAGADTGGHSVQAGADNSASYP